MDCMKILAPECIFTNWLNIKSWLEKPIDYFTYKTKFENLQQQKITFLAFDLYIFFKNIHFLKRKNMCMPNFF